MRSDTKDFAKVADDFVDWWAGHWRSILYSFLAGIIPTLDAKVDAAGGAGPYVAGGAVLIRG